MSNLEQNEQPEKTDFYQVSDQADQRMRDSRALANTTSSAKSRVRGDGPDRKVLPPYKHLIDLPPDLTQELLAYFGQHQQQNDLFDQKAYPIADHCPLKQALPEGFQHLLLTTCPEGRDERLEWSYTQWTASAKKLKFYKWFMQAFPHAFRVRLSALAPGTEFGWHIDTNTSVACRCSANLSGEGAAFEVKQRNSIHSIPMQAGQVHFTNTGWPHRVYNFQQSPRLNLVFGIKFDGISHHFVKSAEGEFS